MANPPETPPAASADLPATLETPENLPAILEQDLPAEQKPELERAADDIATRILAAPEDRALMREITVSSENFQTAANDEFRLLRTSLGNLMDKVKAHGGEGSTSIPEDLLRLRQIMDEMNPYSALEQIKRGQNAGFFSRLFRKVPGVGKILADIAIKYESVQTQVDAITMALDAGKDRLLENSIEIEERYRHLKALQAKVKSEGYKLVRVYEILKNARTKAEAEGDAALAQRLARAEAKVMRRAQNLAVTANAFSQFFVTMNLTLDNHENLSDAITAMVNLTRPVLENGLALKVAQQDEKQIAEALEQTQDYLGKLMVAVAEDARENMDRVADVANRPLARFEDLLRSYQILKLAMEEVGQKEAAMVQAAEQNVAQLNAMTTELERMAQDQEDVRAAGKTL